MYIWNIFYVTINGLRVNTQIKADTRQEAIEAIKSEGVKLVDIFRTEN